jgi:hypothetical protein
MSKLQALQKRDESSAAELGHLFAGQNDYRRASSARKTPIKAIEEFEDSPESKASPEQSGKRQPGR